MPNGKVKWFNLNKQPKLEPPPRPDGQYLIDRSTATQKLLEKWSKGPQKGLQEIEIPYEANRQTRLCLVTVSYTHQTLPTNREV